MSAGNGMPDFICFKHTSDMTGDQYLDNGVWNVNVRPIWEIQLVECKMTGKLDKTEKDKIEWIIIDDGSDKIEDLFINIPYVKYIKLESKMSLGKKRNFINNIVNMKLYYDK
jgi:hypothetical protein